jgi:hypothetical protein
MAISKPSITGFSGAPQLTGLKVDGITIVVDETNDRVGIGTAAPLAQLEIHDTTTSSANTGGALRLSANDGAVMGDSHRLGVIEFTGAEDTSNTQVVGARIEALTDAAWTNAENGCALYFYTTDGNASQTNVLKLDSNKKATFAGDVTISGTTPLLTIGDAGAEDTMLVFDGNAADFRIGIDDGTDTLEIGKGAAHGTTPVIKVDSSTNLQLMHNSAVADGEYSGDIAMFTAGEDLTAGEVVYFKSDGKMWKAVATAAATSRCVAMATASISADAMGVFLMKGFARFNSEFPTWTVGGALYTPEAETGGKNVAEQAAPDTDGDFVQVIGFAVSGDAVYFDPDSTVVEVA